MKIEPGLTRIKAIDLQSGRGQAEQAGYTTFVLPEHGIVDRTSFFDAVRSTLPLDPPLVGSRSWEALADSLWEGIYRHPAKSIAILWFGTQHMARSASNDFETALGVLADVASSLGKTELTHGSPKEVAVIVEE